jgi:AcrR family transcriptional regulator
MEGGMAIPTRDRIVEAGATLFRRQGYSGTGMKAIAAAAQAPFGSIYHFFPGGKDELGGEVIRAAGRVYGGLVAAFFDPQPDVALATRDAFFGAAETVRDSGWADACPIATVALEVASTNEDLRLATAEVFQAWLDSLADRFASAGIAPEEARRLAMSFVAALEGAFVLARSLRDTAPVIAAGETLYAAVRAALDQAETETP